jgi:glycosyltransferase involved in cell wall biosynthesis
MRIVYVLTSLGIGGAEKQTLAVAERMKKRGHAVALLVMKPRIAEEWPSVLNTIHLDIRKTPASLFAGFWRARHFVRAFRPDLLHSHSFHANLFARCLKLLVPRLTVLSTIHNVYEGGWWRMLAYRLTGPLCRRAAAVSKAVAQRFVQLKAVSPQKCVVIANGIDVAEFVPDPERRLRVRATLKVSTEEDGFIWLAAGRVTPAKDYPNLLRAFIQVRSQMPNAKLWIAGALADAEVHRAADGSESFISGISLEKDTRERVRFLGLRRDMPALLDAADAFVSASAWEGMPLAVGEAMAMATPVVATDVGGVRELVGDSGTIVSSENSGALAKAMIVTMQRSVEEREQIGRAARERLSRHFSIEASADAWEALYRELLS